MKTVYLSPARLIATAMLVLFFIPMSAQWNNIYPDGTPYYNIRFVNSNVGYLQDIYRMKKTTNGGSTWITIDSNSTTYVRQDMYWLNANEGFVVMYENLGAGNYAGWFTKTANGGVTWSPMSQLPVNEWYNAIWFVNSLEGYVVGSGGTILKTTNGGTNWSQLTSTTTLDLYSICFVNSTTAYVGGDDGIILMTNNSGVSWTQQYSSIFYEFQDIWFTDPLNGMAVGTYGMLRTTNGGANWNPVSVYGTSQFISVQFPSADTGYVTSIGGNVFRTIDGGATWLGLNRVGQGYFVRDVYFISNDTGFVVADYSGVWKTTSAGFACPSLIVQNTTSMPDTLHSCAGSNAIFTVVPSALNNYPVNISPSWVIDTALSYNQYYYANDTIADDTLNLIIVMTDPFTGCGPLTDMVVLITDSITYQPPPQSTQLFYLCPGDSITLDLGANAQDGYYWMQTGDSTQTIVIDTVGMWNGFAYACGGQSNWFFFVQWDSNCLQVCDVDAGPDTMFCQQQGQLFATPASPGNYQFSWSPTTGLDNPYAQNPNVTSGVHNQQYIVTMTDTANNCTAMDTVIVSAYYWHLDTLYMCQGQPITYDLGPGGTQYTYQFTDTSGNFQSGMFPPSTYVITQPAQYIFVATFPGCGALTSVVTVIDSCNAQYVGNVWPGDCNYDLVVNMADALHIGLANNTSGAVRPNASNAWYAQPMADWTQNYTNCNYKHGDADGNGNINVNDTLPIALNYSMTHPFRLEGPAPVPASALPITLVCIPDTVGLQTLVQIDVVLGTIPAPIDSLYGISFRITSDAWLIDTNLTVINANGSWLGNSGNMFTFQKHFMSSGVIDFAEVKTNHVNTYGGQGVIASFFIVTTDNLSGIQTCHFDITDITALTASQNYVQLSPVVDSVVIDPSVPAGISVVDVPMTFSMYPNPAADQVSIQANHDADLIEICDMTGRVVYSMQPSSHTTIINTASLAEGMYLVRVTSGTEVITDKLTITR